MAWAAGGWMRAAVLVVLVVGAVAALLAGACAADDADADGVRVVATTALIADFASRVAGEQATVETIVPAGADLHSYEPSPGVARTIAQADLVLVNGYGLEGAVLDVVVENRRAGTPVVAVSRGLEPIAGGDGHADEHDEAGEEATGTPEGAAAAEVDPLVFAEGDPHFWLDVSNAAVYVENIGEALAAVDAANADAYRGRAAEVVEELRALDGGVRERLAVVPSDRRKIVVFHDAYSYFARAYDFELVAVLFPASGDQQASARAVSEVVEAVRSEGIPAVYREPQFDPRPVEAVANETGAEVLTLVSTLGDEVDTYEALMRADVEALVEGLGAGAGG